MKVNTILENYKEKILLDLILYIQTSKGPKIKKPDDVVSSGNYILNN